MCVLEIHLGLRSFNPSGRPQHNFLAKIGLLWYETNDFSNAKKPTALRTVPCPKLIGADHLVLAKTKPAVFYCQMRQAELANPVFAQMNSLFDHTNSLFQ
jgi:hypothetical protein